MKKLTQGMVRRTGGRGTYILDGGGADTIEDKQGNNRVFLNGKVLFEFTTSDGTNYLSADGAFSGIMSNGDFIVTDTVTGDQVTLNQNFQSGDFGITLSNTPAAPQYVTTITGDIVPTDFEPGKEGIQAQPDANGNPIGQAGAYADILQGTGGNDHIMTGALSDHVSGLSGADWIEGGAGSDYLWGDGGDDILEGGQGGDILAGGYGEDQLFADTKTPVADAIDSGNTATATGLKGEWLSGNEGSDTLVSGADNDVLAGGGGDDLIVAGAGDDYILGDADYLAQFIREADPRFTIRNDDWWHSATVTFDWSVTSQGNNYLFSHIEPGYETSDPVDAGNDTIYAGNGDDHVWAGSGGDIVYGEGGNDQLDGEAGNDILFGGAGTRPKCIGISAYCFMPIPGIRSRSAKSAAWRSHRTAGEGQISGIGGMFGRNNRDAANDMHHEYERRVA